MNKYQPWNQLKKAQGNSRKQKMVKLQLVPKKEPGIFFKPLASQIELLVKFNRKTIFKKYSKVKMGMYFVILSHRNFFIKLCTLICLLT